MSTQTKHYEQLTQGKRYQLQALLKTGLSLQAMADNLGVHKSTVSHTTIYRLIAQDKANGGKLYRELPRFKDSLERRKT